MKGGVLKELSTDDAPIAAAPGCQIAYLPPDDVENVNEKWTREFEDLDSENDDWLEVPVYTDSQRDILICSLPVRCLKDERDTWLRRGIALHLRSS